MIEVYERAAKAAYENCLRLLSDANLLFNNSRFPRAYALSVLCLEEFAKSFLYKCVSVGLLTADGFSADIRKHDEKLYHALHIMLFPHALDYRNQKFLDAIEHDKHEKDHSKHLSFEAFKRVYDFFSYSDDLSDMTRSTLSVFRDAPIHKLKALYVDIQRDTVIIPDDTVDSKKCIEILNFLNKHVHGFDLILGENDDHFRNLVKLADPFIYSGTMKSISQRYRNPSE